jgi:hypothetical protein
MNSENERTELVERLRRERDELRTLLKSYRKEGRKVFAEAVSERDHAIAERDDYKEAALRLQADAMAAEAERDKTIAERDDYKEHLQAQAMQIEGMREQVRAETARRAVEVCEDVAKQMVGNSINRLLNSKWMVKAEGATKCIQALTAEFGLDKGE